MIKLTQKLNDPNGIVSKLIFEDDEETIVESVIYTYKDRGVVCFSVQSGCPVGCKFCGTGKKFIRNLNHHEIAEQIDVGYELIKDKKKKQFMSMSMGEPMLNFKELMHGFDISPLNINDHFYISTVGIRDSYILGELLASGKRYPNFGLQFSLHSPYEKERRNLLGNYKTLMSIKEIKHYARLWSEWTGKKVYFNYICHTDQKLTYDLVTDIYQIIKGQHLTLSILCNTNNLTKGDPAPASKFANILSILYPEQDYSIFDPAGQDTIGGGCGQLLYVQKKLKG